MAQVRLEKITKQWPGSDGLKETNLEIPDREFCVLVGPSGCGKTTILRIIAGLEAPTSGNLYINNRLVNNLPARQRDIAMVFQNYALYPHMTVAENIGFGLKMRGTNPALRREQVQNVAKSLGLENLLHRKPSQLSGGQQQRVALARAMARHPQVFLLDEPLSNLDAQLRDRTRAELKLLHRQLASTMIYVTHDQTEAMTLADRIVVLDQGKIQQIGTPAAIYAQPANCMVATFLGSPPMNILEAIYTGQALTIGNQTITPPPAWQNYLRSVPQGQHFYIGIRPEDFQLAPDPIATNALRIGVVLEEILGSEKLVHAHLQDLPSFALLLKVKNQPLTQQVYLAADRLHLFDISTGLNLKI